MQLQGVPYGQTDSFNGGKRSALDMWVQADLVTFGEFLTVRAAGARDVLHRTVQQKNSYIGTGMVKHPGANRGRTTSEGPSGDGTTISYRQGFLAWP